MIRIVSITILIASFFLACVNGAFSSKDILGHNEMADLLNEVALAEGYAEMFLFKDTLQSKDSLVQRELDKVLQLHKISIQQFTKSYHYYKTHPEEFRILVDTANARASRNREKVYDRRRVNPS